jgi:DNA-binding NarL/FixJ family response regulator
MESKPIRIILADDHEIFRDGFKAMLRKQPSVQLLAEAADGLELVALCRQLMPDVVVTDIKMPNMDGLEATKILVKDMPQIGIIALSMLDEESMIVDIMEAGAKGYLMKNAHKEEIIQAIRTVHSNEIYYCSQTSNKIAYRLAKNNKIKHSKMPERHHFNSFEFEVIRCVCREMSNREMAERLNLSIRTIEKYRERIQDKIGAKNLAGIVIFAIRNNIYTVD